MTVTITGTGANRTITWSQTKPSAKVLSGSDLAAKYLFGTGRYGDHGTAGSPRTYTDLTNAERLAILDKYFNDVIRDAAWTQNGIDRKKADDALNATTINDFDLNK